MIEIVCAAIAAVGGIVATVVSVSVKKSQKEADKKAERRKQEAMLSLEMMSANSALCTAIANAVLNKKNNGNVEEAYRMVAEAEKKYKDFQIKVLAEEIS